MGGEESLRAPVQVVVMLDRSIFSFVVNLIAGRRATLDVSPDGTTIVTPVWDRATVILIRISARNTAIVEDTLDCLITLL
jgi:hypothetical protein